jgi:hypothetical protein
MEAGDQASRTSTRSLRRLMSSDWVKGGLCFLACFAWAPIAVRLVPHTPIGLAIVLAPFGALVLAGAFFLLRAQFKNLLS